MKTTQYIFGIILVFIFSEMNGQCFLDRHDTSEQSAWESCSTSSNPNPVRGNGHWLLYDLGAEYEIGQLHFWNYNHFGETDKGVKDLIIDYRISSTGWLGGINHTVAQANASGFYEGEAGPQLGGANVRYLLLTFENNYGGSCYGLSELRIGIYQDPCDQITLDVHEIPVINGLYHAEQILNSEGLINTTSDVLFQSEQEISLEPGFESKIGAMFEAKIEDCPTGN